MKSNNYRGFRDLIVYQKSYDLAIRIFHLTKSFPKEEKYAMTDQIRRSSRSVPENIAESWPKRRYPKSFVSKIIDSLSEEAETEFWLDMSKDLEYITITIHEQFIKEYDEVRRMLIHMSQNPGKFCFA
jgi:four helix bundle protein